MYSATKVDTNSIHHMKHNLQLITSKQEYNKTNEDGCK